MQEFLVGYHKTIKDAGRGDTKNRSEIPSKSWDFLMEHLFILQELMEADKSSERFQELLRLLPSQFYQKWHYLLQWGAILILLAFTAKRGREGIQNLRADHFEKLWSEELGIHYYAQIIEIGSKNHKVDDQGMSDEGKGGICSEIHGRGQTSCREHDSACLGEATRVPTHFRGCRGDRKTRGL